MNETLAPKKKMSTGCLVAIIIGVFLLIAIAGGLYWVFKNPDKIAKMGVSNALGSVKTIAAADLQPGVDTVQVDAVADQLNTEIQATEKLDLLRIKALLDELQKIVSDKKLDSTEVVSFFNAARTYDPNLNIPEPPPSMTDTTGAATDTTGM